jgi:uncharacterized protein (DUF488 family)
MERKPIYTIGHGSRKNSEFVSVLKKFGIQYLVDVRSQPYSKFNPQFNQNDLKFTLESNGIKYVFMGESLGGRPSDLSCYDREGKVDYELVKTKDFFIKGIDRLKTAYEKEVPIVIMCSESKPGECHRSKLIGRVLQTDGIILQHIDEKDRIKGQADVINELKRGSKYSFVNSTRLQEKLSSLDIKYGHIIDLAPTEEIRELQKKDDYIKGILKSERQVLGDVFVSEYKDKILNKFNFEFFFEKLDQAGANNIVLFCVEELAQACHRSIVAEKLSNSYSYDIINL